MNADFPLPPIWRDWVMDNLVHDIPHANIIRKLVEKGLSESAARRETALVCAAYSRQLNGYARFLRRLRGRASALVEATSLEPDRFWAEHWEVNRPLVLRGYTSAWPALSRWSFQSWRENYAHLPVQVEVDRDPARNFDGRYEELTLGAFLAQIDTSEAAAPRNDIYCVARNRNAARPEWQPLYDDLDLDERLFDRSRLAGGSSLWLGPRGTFTPLHHDLTNIFFCQVVGTKRFQLLPPHTTELWPRMDGYYVRGDLEGVPGSVQVFEVELGPGDVLFIPAGWFHRVEALEASISYSLLNFRRANDFSDFSLVQLAREPEALEVEG